MKNKKINFGLILFIAFAILFIIIDFFPFLWSLYGSLRPTKDVYNPTIDFSNLSLDAYKHIWDQFNISKWYINSVIVAVIVTTGSVLISAMGGYSLARFDYPFKNFVFYLILGVMMIPGQVTLIPTYTMISKLGWVNSYTGLTIPFLFNAFNLFMMRQFYLSFPAELEEAAKIDGMHPIATFFKIALPLAKAPLTTLVILTFMGNWNSFLFPSLLTTRMDMYTMPVGMSMLQGQYFAYPNQVMAGAMFITVPTIIFYLIFQKNFMEGLSDAAVKG